MASIGIDLGTTNSCAAVWKDDGVKIIFNEVGSRVTPSYVAFTNATRLIGDAAKDHAKLDPENTIFDAKRLIGREFSDKIVQSDKLLWPFKVISGEENRPMFQVKYKGEEKKFSPEQISGMVLSDIKQLAERFLGSSVKDAVVTVPAYFNDSQRQATKDAGTIAGLNVIRIINEPTAAAIAYGLDKKKDGAGNRNVLIFDLGGGTLDVSILTIGDGIIQVKATDGDTHLGGEDFVNRMLNHFMSEIQRKYKMDISQNPRALMRLRQECETAKKKLSADVSAPITVDALHEGVDFSTAILRSKFEYLNKDLFMKCVESVRKCLEESKMEKGSIDDIVLVGGSTRIPKIKSLLEEFFPGKKLSSSINPEEAVAEGAAVLAAILSGNQEVQDMELLDVTPLSLGVKKLHSIMDVVIPRNTIIPVKIEKEYITHADNQDYFHIHVYEGERKVVHDNNFLGDFKLEGIPQAPRGAVEVKVCFEINASGILTVYAEEEKSGNKKEMKVTHSMGRFSKDEIKRFIREAEIFNLEDEGYKNKVELRNSFQNSIYDIRSEIQDLSEKLGSDDMNNIVAAVDKAEQWLDKTELELGGLDEIHNQMEELKNVWDPIITKMKGVRMQTQQQQKTQPGRLQGSQRKGKKKARVGLKLS